MRSGAGVGATVRSRSAGRLLAGPGAGLSGSPACPFLDRAGHGGVDVQVDAGDQVLHAPGDGAESGQELSAEYMICPA